MFPMKTVPNLPPAALGRPRERGAALITVMLISILLLLAGGALIMVTSISASNAADATAESQAYYAAESGLQATLGVLRGNVAPSPLINTSSATAPENKISFRKVLTASTSNTPSDTNSARLSRWLNYDSTYTDRVVISDNYTPMSGMAYTVEGLVDPDASDTISFSVSGAFDNSSASKNFGNNGNGFTLTYTPRSSTTVSTGGSSAASDLGSFTISSANGSYTLANETFNLTITQTAPWASSTVIKCSISGVVAKVSGNTTSTLLLTFPAQSYELGGVLYTVSSLTESLLASGATTMPVTVTAPEPRRLVIKVRGYGPRNAAKRMQMIVSRSAFDYKASGAITLRSDDVDTNAMPVFNPGSSVQYQYNGYDNSNGPGLPAFTVTNSADYTEVGHYLNSQITGTAQVQQAPINSLSPFLQTADAARALVNQLRNDAMNQRTPGCTGTAAACDRYFASGETPSDFGASYPNGLLTFVDGDVDLPPAGGAGLLVVTGTLTLNGSSQFDGLILVLGTGQLLRTGGGNGTSLGSMVVASFGATGGFTAPSFNSSGSGNSNIRYDSDWVRKALTTGGPVVLGVSEY
jgi:Tfp pilus assembly protein PilX